LGNLSIYSETQNQMKKISYSPLQIFALFCLISGLLLSSGASLMAAATQSQLSQENPTVHVLVYEGIVTPVLERLIEENIDNAIEAEAEALIIQLDTPGGNVDVTKSITQKMRLSSVPIIVYVSPLGAHAGSAGTFITLAGHAAAMAPGSSIGAASPVDGSGGDIGGTMQEKIVNILSADIENLAAPRGEEATEWAIATVREAAAATADQALEMGVIDFIAADLPHLLEQLNGFEVFVNDEPRTLETTNAFIELIEQDWVQRLLGFLANPSIASLLLSIGTAGLLLEIRTPGFGVPGIVGAICLLLALALLGQMDANMSGLALIGLGLALFIAELFTPTFGVLALGGIASFIAGSVLLFDVPGVETPWIPIISFAALLGIFTMWAGGLGLAAQRQQAITGSEGLIGQVGVVKKGFDIDEKGSVLVSGEWWNAKLDNGELAVGDEVTVVSQDGYTLHVAPRV